MSHINFKRTARQESHIHGLHRICQGRKSDGWREGPIPPAVSLQKTVEKTPFDAAKPFFSEYIKGLKYKLGNHSPNASSFPSPALQRTWKRLTQINNPFNK